MNDIAIKVDELAHKVNNLEELVRKLVNINSRLVSKLKVKGTVELDAGFITSEESLLMGSALFNVTSTYDPDDDLISPNTVIRPVDWSGYA